MVVTDDVVEFSLSFSRPMRALMMAILAGPRRCRVTLRADRLDVAMGLGGWAFAAHVDRPAIIEVVRVRGPVWSRGAHGWRGKWLVNGSSRGLVRLTLRPSQHGRCVVFPIRLRQLTLSLEDPDGFVAALPAAPPPS